MHPMLGKGINKRVVGDLQLQSLSDQGLHDETGRKCALCASSLKQKDDEIIWIWVGKTDLPSYEMIRCQNNTCTIHRSNLANMMWVKWANMGGIKGVFICQIVRVGLQPRQQKWPDYYHYDV
jgi:hypothetical protein